MIGIKEGNMTRKGMKMLMKKMRKRGENQEIKEEKESQGEKMYLLELNSTVTPSDNSMR